MSLSSSFGAVSMRSRDAYSLTGARFLEKSLSRFGRDAPILTEKLRESVISGLNLARNSDSSPHARHFMYGLIETRSIAVPILDSLGMDVVEYARKLRTDPGMEYSA